MDLAAGLLELSERGFCVLPALLPVATVEACRTAFWPGLLGYLSEHGESPNRGPHRHFLPMPFHPPCFAPEFFSAPEVLALCRVAMDDRIVADQWGCDVPVRGSEYQQPHMDFERPLFAEQPDLLLPPYMMAVSFGLTRITAESGPIEIAPGTHRLPREQALASLAVGTATLEPVLLNFGDVLIRHPWALHRGTPNLNETPRALVTIRYVRRWYADGSRQVSSIPQSVWRGLTPEQRGLLRFPVAG